MIENDSDIKELYSVIGVREEYIGDNEKTKDIVILGTFQEVSEALIFMESQKDLNTTLQDVTVVSSNFMSELPEMEIFVLVYVEEGIVSARTVPLSVETEPMLRDDTQFEALGEFADKEKLIELAKKWHISRYKKVPEVDDYSSPAVSDYI